VAALRLYAQLVSASLRAQMQYKIDFIVSTFLDAIFQAVDFVLLAAIMLRFPEIAGWTLYEIGLLYGMSWIAMSLYRTFAPELHNFDRYIVQGNFDSLLIRPWPTLMVLLSRNLELRKIGGALQGALVFWFSASHLLRSGRLEWGEVAILIGLSVTGTLIPFALSLATAACSFWIVRSGDLQTFTMYAPITASQYPLSVFPGWLRALLSSVLPVAFINYVPVQYLLEKGGSAWSLVSPPVVSALCLIAAYSLWRLGERRYHSTGT